VLTVTTFTGDNCKYAFMKYLYGAGKNTLIVRADDQSIGHLFPADLDIDTKWQVFINSMEAIVPAAVQYMEVIYMFTDSKRSKYNWTMPDGFKVETTTSITEEIVGNYFKLPYTEDGEASTASGRVHVRRETGVELDRSLAPNIIHSIDGYIVREVVRRASFDIVPNHDSFGVHPNNVDDIRRLYKEVCADILEMNLLEDILGQLNPGLLERIQKRGLLPKGKLTRAKVLKSAYPLR